MESEKNSAESQWLAERVFAGESAAADELFRRYLRRLTALARARLAPQVGRRVDPEDAVQSAFRSFFIGARTGRFEIQASGDLWRLLATITARKAARLTTRHRAQKRAVGREAPPVLSPSGSDLFPGVARGPSPAEAAALADELTQIMRELPPEKRRLLALRLQDTAPGEIAVELKRTPRTIRRWLEELEVFLRERFGFDAPSLRPLKVDEVSADEDLTGDGPVEIERPIVRLPAGGTVPKNAGGILAAIDFRDLVLEAHLGSGGMGRVYRARQRSSDRPVAVKVLRKAWQTDRRGVERFLAEARTIGGLDHQRITPILGLGRMPGGGYFFVMPLVEGGDLQQRIDAKDYGLEQLEKWFRQAAEGVEYAHARRVVHCDLKPSNLLLDRSGDVVVSDFGFALALEAAERPLGGTPAYAAPELLGGRRGAVSPAIDVWGLGAVLHALACGRPPAAGDGAEAWTEEASECLERLQPAGEGADVGRLAVIGRRCLSVDPKRRYGDAGELVRALDDAVIR